MTLVQHRNCANKTRVRIDLSWSSVPAQLLLTFTSHYLLLMTKEHWVQMLASIVLQLHVSYQCSIMLLLNHQALYSLPMLLNETIYYKFRIGNTCLAMYIHGK